MIFNILFILMILSEFIYKSFITAICSQTLGSH